MHAVKLSQQKPGRINEALALTIISVLLALMLALIAGVEALGFALITAWIAQTLVATIDYVEHWGLQRAVVDGKPEPSARCTSGTAKTVFQMHCCLICRATRRIISSPRCTVMNYGM